MRDLDADGIIAHTWDVDTIQIIIDSGLPSMICGINKPISNTYRLVTDEVAVGRMAAEYFLNRGFTRFAFCGFENMIWSQRRGKNFCKTVGDCGFETCFYRQSKADRLLNEEKEQNNIAKWLKSLPKPIAVMACNDDKGRDILAAWKIVDEQGNNVYSQYKQSEYEPPVRSPVNIARVSDLNVGDFVLHARMKQTGKEYGHRDMCLFFGYQDSSHFYYVHLATMADEHANSIFLVNGQPRVSIARQRIDGTDWSTGYHDVRIVRDTKTGDIEVFYDDLDNSIMRAVDKTFLSGGIGFGSFDDTGNIDDVILWANKNETNK